MFVSRKPAVVNLSIDVCLKKDGKNPIHTAQIIQVGPSMSGLFSKQKRAVDDLRGVHLDANLKEINHRILLTG